METSELVLNIILCFYVLLMLPCQCERSLPEELKSTVS